MQAGELEASFSKALTSSKLTCTLVAGKCECRVCAAGLPGPPGPRVPVSPTTTTGVGRRREGHGDLREGGHSFPSSLGPLHMHCVTGVGKRVSLSPFSRGRLGGVTGLTEGG